MKAEALSSILFLDSIQPNNDNGKAPEVHRISVYAYVLYHQIFPPNHHKSKKHNRPKNPSHIMNRNVLDFCSCRPSQCRMVASQSTN